MAHRYSEQAKQFAKLHEGPDILILANAWDGISAKIVEGAGGKAIATSSAAVAWAHGYRDGNVLPADLLLASVRAVSRSVSIPISVDFEAGYSDDPEAVAVQARDLLAVGAAGINIEDGILPPELLAAKIRAIKSKVRDAGGSLFINARTDVYLRGLEQGEEAFKEAVSRSRLYREAGCDGIFVPGVTDADLIRRLASGIAAPLNVLARAGLPDAAQLQALGVRRLSAGSGLAQKMWNHMAETATRFLAKGNSDELKGGARTFADLNALF
jgi:2-methylisocitrate lyase-like PEP mutase family enzyme